MPFKIIGVEVVASYDTMTKKPGELRPLPALISARLAEKMTESIRMQEVVSEAMSRPAIVGDLMSALFMARQQVEGIMNANLIGAATPVELDTIAAGYWPTSTGGHHGIGWVKKSDGAGGTDYWGFNLEIQGESIYTYACLGVTLQEIAARSIG